MLRTVIGVFWTVIFAIGISFCFKIQNYIKSLIYQCRRMLFREILSNGKSDDVRLTLQDVFMSDIRYAWCRLKHPYKGTSPYPKNNRHKWNWKNIRKSWWITEDWWSLRKRLTIITNLTLFYHIYRKNRSMLSMWLFWYCIHFINALSHTCSTDVSQTATKNNILLHFMPHRAI